MIKSHDYHFPLLTFRPELNPFERGEQHGETFKTAIKELYEIRKELLLFKSPHLKDHLEQYADLQFQETKKMSLGLAQELEGLARGSSLSLSSLVLLNNYTDFRDLKNPGPSYQKEEEGCSTVHVQKNGQNFSGQTWDMHGTAKNYLMMLHIPASEKAPESLVLSLTGCLGLMGINSKKCFMGVNNINTLKAQNGIIWPALVRHCLEQNSLEKMREELKKAKVTSGHNYLLSNEKEGEHWEITPTLQEKVSSLKENSEGAIFHTNHCLGVEIEKIEDKTSLSSTTHCRFDLLQKNIHKVVGMESFYELLTSHEGHPKSICSHYMAMAIDPSLTCGGGIANLDLSQITFWRGCPSYDQNYKEYHFKFKNNHFQKITEI